MSAAGSVRPGADAWIQLVLAELRMVARDTAGLVVPLGMPVLIMVMFALGDIHEPLDGLAGRTPFEVYVVPLALTMVVAVIGVVNMPSFLATYRKTGVLQRLSVTPAHPAMVLVAQVITSLVQTVAGVGIALGVAAAAFGLGAPARPGAAIAIGSLVAAAMYALGMLVAAISPTANASVAIGLVVFFAMGAVGGMFGPVENLPAVLARVGEVLPFGASIASLQAAWIGRGVEVVHLASLGTTTLVASVVAAVTFRWR